MLYTYDVLLYVEQSNDVYNTVVRSIVRTVYVLHVVHCIVRELYAVQPTMYSVHCTAYSVRRIVGGLFTPHCVNRADISNNVRRTLYVHCTTYSVGVRDTMYNVQCTQCTVYTMYNVCHTS